ncbi:MAG TPA: RluA family pseudouridine synthase [Polyangiaceae bacterium]|nr:RluA family pseudouridine synthase [Polyangiaceae bacterium]
MAQRLRVRTGDGETIAEVLARAGVDGAAVAEGRVFLGRRRVRDGGEAVGEGTIVDVAPPRSAPRSVRIVMQEDDLVAVDKPAGMPTIPDHAGAAHALVHVAAKTLGIEAARLHPTSRLDRDVSGVVVFALTKEAADRLLRARASGTYDRRYVALATKAPEPLAGTWDAPLGRARDPRLRMVRGRDPIAAATRYAVCAASPSGVAMLGVAPVTGRTHQIRVHASHAGAPLVGDRDYGGPTRVTLPTGRVLEPRRVALHARRVVVPNAKGTPVQVEAAVPPELESLWSALGGDPAAWDLAAACDPGG